MRGARCSRPVSKCAHTLRTHGACVCACVSIGALSHTHPCLCHGHGHAHAHTPWLYVHVRMQADNTVGMRWTVVENPQDSERLRLVSGDKAFDSMLPKAFLSADLLLNTTQVT